ncbi:MAG: hypothetical protein CL607_21775 [Anaerolineaceae bacterium]|nr:hypothetical protein [Anaerolineaceae bacterium]
MTDYAAGYMAYDLDIDGRTLRAYRTGGDKPQVVLVHGFTDSAISMKALIDMLQDDYDVIAYDSRGHGHSARIDQPYSVLDLADDLAGIIDALELDKPIIVGHSMGAATVLVAGARHPNHMRAIIAEDPPMAPVNKTHRIDEWKAGHIEMTQKPLDEVIRLYMEQFYPKWGELDIRTRAEARYQLDVAVFDQMELHKTPDWHEWAGDIKCEGLILAGNPELGGIAIWPLAEEFVTLWKGGKVIKFPGAGHQIRSESPDAYAEAILPFLAEHSR